jgi:hypothetical protein
LRREVEEAEVVESSGGKGAVKEKVGAEGGLTDEVEVDVDVEVEVDDSPRLVAIVDIAIGGCEVVVGRVRGVITTERRSERAAEPLILGKGACISATRND